MTKPYSENFQEPNRHYEVAIVLGGFAFMNEETGQLKYLTDRAERLWEAVRLYKNGTVNYILITGDAVSQIKNDSTSTTELFLKYMYEIGIPRNAFILEQKSLNTRENASFTTDILKEMNIPPDECLLISSAIHLERGVAAFEKENYQLDYFPVNIYRKPQGFSWMDLYPKWSVAVKWEELLNEWIGRIAYKIVGYN